VRGQGREGGRRKGKGFAAVAAHPSDEALDPLRELSQKVLHGQDGFGRDVLNVNLKGGSGG
jgi:hypothetical protein